MQAGATINWLANQADRDVSGSPVSWLFHEPNTTSPITSRSLVSGINVSDTALEKVHATLKPDSSQREIKLALSLDGNKSKGEEAIPAGARLSLGLDAPTTIKEELFGGAIFAFRYRYAGQQRAMIWYLTPTLIARLAKRG